MTNTGIGLIATERNEQLHKHSWSIERDAQYVNGELVDAAVQYLGGGDINCWPESWDKKWYKPGNRIDELKRAGALIAAEIDRLLLKTQTMTTEINYEQKVKEAYPDATVREIGYFRYDRKTWEIIGFDNSGWYVHIDTVWLPKDKNKETVWQTAYNHLVKLGKIQPDQQSKSDAEVAAEREYPVSDSVYEEAILCLQRLSYIKGYNAKQSDCDTSKLTRVEVIGNGREYVNMNTGNVTLSFQDEGRTLKVFVEKGRKQQSDAVKFYCFMENCDPDTPIMYKGEWVTIKQLYEQFKNR